jgi:hypothetical protein
MVSLFYKNLNFQVTSCRTNSKPILNNITGDVAMKIWLKPDEQKTKYKHERALWKANGSRVLRKQEKNSRTMVEELLVVI